jgi:hypothetical protein
MAKSKYKVEASKGQAHAKASAATARDGKGPGAGASRRSNAAHDPAPASTDIRRAYKKSLLGDYLGKHRGQDAIKPKK